MAFTTQLFICSYVCIAVLFSAIDSSVCDTYCITPLQNSTRHESCSALSEFTQNVSSFSVTKNATVVLIFQPGNHSLNVTISLVVLHTFSMESVSSNPLDTTITCADSVALNFDLVVNVQILGLTLKGCTENRISTTKKFKLQHCVVVGNLGFQQSVSAALIVNRSEVEILNTSFSGFSGSLWELRRLKAKKYINLTHSLVGGAIISSGSNITIDSSTFQNNSAQIGGVIFAELGSNITVLNCTFINNVITCQQRICYGGVIFLDTSYVQIKNSNFIGNKNIHADNYTITKGGAFGAFYSINITIQDSWFNDNIATFGGALFFRYCPTINVSKTVFSYNRALSFGGVVYTKNCYISIVNTTFNGNTASKSGGALWTESSRENTATGEIGGAMKLTGMTKLQLFMCNFTNNSALSSGGAIFANRSNISFSKSYLKLNSAFSGAAAYVIHGSVYLERNNIFEENTGQLGIIGFYHSSASIGGKLLVTNNSGSVILFDSKFEVVGKSKRNVKIVITNNRPYSHSSSTNHDIEEGGGITSILSEMKVYGKIIINGNFASNGGGILAISSNIFISGQGNIINNIATNTGGGIYLYQSMLLHEGNLMISNNTAKDSGGGIHSVSSLLISRLTYIKGENKTLAFVSNLAVRGGGAFLEVHSKFYIAAAENTMSIRFISNSAQYGGAIYVNDETNNGTCTSSRTTVTAAAESECFFQSISVITDTRPLSLERNIFFSNNYATISGGILFGGLLDRCTINVFNDTSSFSRVEYSSQPNFVKDIFNSTTSNAVRVCFCRNDDQKPDCDFQPEPIRVMKGQPFTLSVVAVDHVNHTLSAKIHSYLSNKESRLGTGRNVQNANSNCTKLKFWVYSKLDRELLTLYANGPCSDAGVSKRQVAIKILPCSCAVGFQPLKSDSTKCKCVCNSTLQMYVSNCDPLTNLIERNTDAWIASFDNNSYLVFPHCPFDYCHLPNGGTVVNIDLSASNGSDAQCAYNRSGILCSLCQPGLSLSLGSSRCIPCSRYWPALFIVITVGACVAGVALIFLMLVLNLTVATGTLNGIIFYANILAANKTIILPFAKPNIITVILAWLNLDIGFETCYFKGMDSYTKAWIELCFPIYVTFLVAMIMLVCKYSTKFSSLIGKMNPVSTLATLILLSYAKILQSTISAMTYAVLKYPDGSQEVVWRPDATLKYIRGKHSALFLVALLLLVLGIAYTILLLLWQWLLSLSNMYLFKWVKNTKLTSFMDAYHAPYTPNKRYWTGLLLLARVVVYIVSAVNVSGEPSVNLLAISLVVTSLFILKYNVYKVWLIDVMETGLYTNLIIFSVGKLYLLRTENHHAAHVIAYISTGIATTMLLCILFYHVIISLPITFQSWIQQVLMKIKKQRVSNNDLTTPFLDDADNTLLKLAASTREE